MQSIIERRTEPNVSGSWCVGADLLAHPYAKEGRMDAGDRPASVRRHASPLIITCKRTRLNMYDSLTSVSIIAGPVGIYEGNKGFDVTKNVKCVVMGDESCHFRVHMICISWHIYVVISLDSTRVLSVRFHNSYLQSFYSCSTDRLEKNAIKHKIPTTKIQEKRKRILYMKENCLEYFLFASLYTLLFERKDLNFWKYSPVAPSIIELLGEKEMGRDWNGMFVLSKNEGNIEGQPNYCHRFPSLSTE